MQDCAGVVELVDARDSKSRVPWGRVGSIPTAGTNEIRNLREIVIQKSRVPHADCDKFVIEFFPHATLEASRAFIPTRKLSA